MTKTDTQTKVNLTINNQSKLSNVSRFSTALPKSTLAGEKPFIRLYGTSRKDPPEPSQSITLSSQANTDETVVHVYNWFYYLNISYYISN